MLSKLESLLLVLVFSFVLLSSLSLALTINCDPCEVGNCHCNIEQCSSGILRIYDSSSCRIPKYEYTFYQYQFSWSDASVGPFYFKAFCSDGQSTECNNITVSGGPTTSKTSTSMTTTKKTTTSIKSGTSTTTEGTDGNKDYTWIYVAVLAIAIVVFVLIFLIFKNRPKKSYEQLYAKWRR